MLVNIETEKPKLMMPVCQVAAGMSEYVYF